MKDHLDKLAELLNDNPEIDDVIDEYEYYKHYYYGGAEEKTENFNLCGINLTNKNCDFPLNILDGLNYWFFTSVEKRG